MLSNYLKIAYRNLLRNKLYSGINIVGLAVGLSACIVIMLFVKYENGYDKIHTKNLYRLDEVQKFEGMVAPQKVALSMAPMGPTLKEEYPEVKNFVRIDDQETSNSCLQPEKSRTARYPVDGCQFPGYVRFSFAQRRKGHRTERTEYHSADSEKCDNYFWRRRATRTDRNLLWPGYAGLQSDRNSG